MIRAWVPAILLALLAGCSRQPSPEREVPPAISQVDAVWVRVPVSPLATMGEGPAPDAVVMDVLLFGHQGGGMPVTGSLEILFFEGKATQDLMNRKPFHVETFSNAVLRRGTGSGLREGMGLLGVSYQGAVPWGAKPPACKEITIVGRYVPPEGSPVMSEPTSVILPPS